MPYKQVFHNNPDLNNRYVDKPLMYEGDGMFDSIISGVKSIAGNAGSFIKNNKDLISSGVKLTSGIKNIVDTYDNHNLAVEQNRQMRERFNTEQAMYRKIIDKQNELKRLQLATPTSNPNIYVEKNEQVNNPLLPLNGPNTNNVTNTSSLNNAQMAAIQNMSRGGRGLKKGGGLRIY